MFIYKLTLSHDTIAYIDSNEQKSQQRTVRIKIIAEKKNDCFQVFWLSDLDEDLLIIFLVICSSTQYQFHLQIPEFRFHL